MNFNPEYLAQEAIHWLIIGGVVMTLVIITSFVTFHFCLRWWYPDPAVRSVWRCRKQIEESFGVRMNYISREGWMKVSPKYSESWARDYLSDELSNFVGRPVTARFRSGTVHFYSKPELPEKVRGKTHFDGRYLTVGIEVDTVRPAKIKLAENGCMVIAGGPGSGKTVLANSILRAIKDFSPRSHVSLFDGKPRLANDDQYRTARLDEELKKLEQTMNDRLIEKVNRWHNRDPELVFYAIDEVHVLVNHTGEKKAVLEERIARMRRIASLGREAGVMLCLITQRATADAIPSPIRTVAGVSICGRVANKSAVEAGLGRLPDDDEPNPLRLSKAGRFVIDDGTGPWREVQTFAPS